MGWATKRQRVFKKIKQVRMLDKMPALERWRQTPVPGIVKKIEQLSPRQQGIPFRVFPYDFAGIMEAKHIQGQVVL